MKFVFFHNPTPFNSFFELYVEYCLFFSHYSLTCNISEIERKKEAKQREREAREKEARKREKAEEKEKRRKEYNAQMEALAAKEEQRKKSEEKKKKKAQAAGGTLVFVWYKSFSYINATFLLLTSSCPILGGAAFLLEMMLH